MVQNITVMLATSILLTACVSSLEGSGNPASVFCIKQGGQSEILKDKDGGEYGICRFPNGEIVEEWTYFRKYHP